MQHRLRLVDLEHTFEKQLARLRYNVHLALPNERWHERESRITSVSVDLLNSWANFIRAYYLSCAFGARTRSMLLVTPPAPFANENTAIGYAIQLFRPHALPNVFGQWHRRDEPAWHDPNVLLQLSTALNLQNLATIQAAFSLNLRVFMDLPVFRNFYAHRNRGTLLAAQLRAPNYGLPTNYRTTQLLFSNPLGRPQPLIFEWLDEIQVTADFMCD